MTRKAIVTLAIGDKYIAMFDNMCRREWSIYCQNFGYDLIVIKHPLDCSQRAYNRSPAWQKLLICSQEWSANYEQIVWIDTDIFINSNKSEDICTEIPIEKISAVEAYSIPTKQLQDISLKRLYKSWDIQGIKYLKNLLPYQYYENRGILVSKEITSVVQTGVFVCSPKYHKDLFEHIYYQYEDCHGADYNYEMPAMSYEIIRNDFHNWINPEYNYCISNITSAFYPFLFDSHQEFYVYSHQQATAETTFLLNNKNIYNKVMALRNIYELGNFIHFAGCASLMPLLHENLTNYPDLPP